MVKMTPKRKLRQDLFLPLGGTMAGSPQESWAWGKEMQAKVEGTTLSLGLASPQLILPYWRDHIWP